MSRLPAACLRCWLRNAAARLHSGLVTPALHSSRRLSGQEGNRFRGRLFQNGKHYSCFESEPSDFKRVRPSPSFSLCISPAVFGDCPFSTPTPCTALLIFIERRSPKGKRVYNPSEKRSRTQRTVRAGWGNAARTGRMAQHVQESCWHQRENVWKPSAFRSHVTTLSVYSMSSSPPASSLCHQLLSGCPGFASSLASTPATSNVCCSPKPSYQPAACIVFALGCSLRLVPSPVSTTFFHNNPLQDKYLLASFSSPPAHTDRSQPFTNRSLCSGGCFLPVAGLVSKISISGRSVPTSGLLSRHSSPSPHPTSSPCFKRHSNNLIPGLTWHFGSSVCLRRSLSLSPTPRKETRKVATLTQPPAARP